MATKTGGRKPSSKGRKIDGSSSRGETTNQSLSVLAGVSIAMLRYQYTAIVGKAPPAAFGKDLLSRSVAQHIQFKAHGNLPADTQRALVQVINARVKKTGSVLPVPRRIKIGSELVREWKGKTYRVVIIAKGFSFNGKEYGSLSEIASHITGTNWNGPRFFGMRSATKRVNTDGQ